MAAKKSKWPPCHIVLLNLSLWGSQRNNSEVYAHVFNVKEYDRNTINKMQCFGLGCHLEFQYGRQKWPPSKIAFTHLSVLDTHIHLFMVTKYNITYFLTSVYMKIIHVHWFRTLFYTWYTHIAPESVTNQLKRDSYMTLEHCYSSDIYTEV